jgi:hypothetical protein
MAAEVEAKLAALTAADAGEDAAEGSGDDSGPEAAVAEGAGGAAATDGAKKKRKKKKSKKAKGACTCSCEVCGVGACAWLAAASPAVRERAPVRVSAPRNAQRSGIKSTAVDRVAATRAWLRLAQRACRLMRLVW